MSNFQYRAGCQRTLNSSAFRWLACAVCVLVGAMAGCRSAKEKPAAPPPAEIAVAHPLVVPIVEWDEYIGRLEPIDTVEVRSRVSGMLESTHFTDGQLVKQDDLLAIIDPREFVAEKHAAAARLEEANARLTETEALRKQADAELADATAQLALAGQLMERARQLAANNALSQEEFDVRESAQLQAKAAFEAANAKIESANAGIATAQAAIGTAKANLEAADLKISYTQILAPISGRISRRLVTEGNLISGGTAGATLLTTIVSVNPIHCYFDANEQDFLKYARLSREGKRESSRDVKNPVYMRLINESGFPHLGHMDFVDNRMDANTGTMRARAIFSNQDDTLTAGLFAEVRIPGSGRYEAVLIPDSAINSDQSERFVYLVSGENKVERRRIELGPMAKGLRVVRSGLVGTEQLVINGLQMIAEGAVVKPKVVGLSVSTGPEELPDDYQPVSEEDWLSHPISAAPLGAGNTEKAISVWPNHGQGAAR
ncbi:efflux RND transporter periplasmic adaptor subunit [Aureliella helgolandensis]|uniref:Efflux pump periplasmic linker BepF n=1 Tax=Aureliella helgolandensis TaxID=2527968 RepID=A0A518GEW6_9BACT|nr:efflux RND transporter periplasmic adaptor subunit [Aureliella helgolandensis]QDV27133.1 Efflux pump periplasmic linker BepF [Aureliella helgolandensis]